LVIRKVLTVYLSSRLRNRRGRSRGRPGLKVRVKVARTRS
jgi:hypothetical protein